MTMADENAVFIAKHAKDTHRVSNLQLQHPVTSQHKAYYCKKLLAHMLLTQLKGCYPQKLVPMQR